MDQPEHWYALTSVLLFFKMLANSLYQGFHRIGKLTFKNPEDAAFAGRQAATEELPQVRRAAQAWLNDLENIPIFLALGIAYIWVGAAADSVATIFLTFTVARCLHTFFYLRGIQPWRTLAYAVGLVCTLVMCVLIIAKLL